MIDYLIVGAGFYGAICAHELSKAGKSVVVIDKRKHIGGNCYTETRDDINIHKYGAHIFHTSNEKVWKWINQFAEFNDYRHHVVANYKDEYFSLPFSLWTFNKLWGVGTPQEAMKKIEEDKDNIEFPQNLKEQAIALVGKEVYTKLIEGYTQKQWLKSPEELPASIIKRLPVRYTWNNNYFYDVYQGIPKGGYTPIFEKLLKGINVKLETDFFTDEIPEHENLIYTGAIDEFFDYRFGSLEYKTVRLEHSRLNLEDFQGTSVVNYTDKNIPFTRIIEHKHFEAIDSKVTWISHEYPIEYEAGVNEPYYPVNDEVNNNRYRQYVKLAQETEINTYFGGRLGSYKYYDMHNVIEEALLFVDSVLDNNN